MSGLYRPALSRVRAGNGSRTGQRFRGPRDGEFRPVSRVGHPFAASVACAAHIFNAIYLRGEPSSEHGARALLGHLVCNVGTDRWKGGGMKGGWGMNWDGTALLPQDGMRIDVSRSRGTTETRDTAGCRFSMYVDIDTGDCFWDLVGMVWSVHTVCC